MNGDDIPHELYGLVENLTQAGFQVSLVPVGRVGNPLDYRVHVLLKGLTTAQLRQLLAIVGGTPYDGEINAEAWLVLQAP